MSSIGRASLRAVAAIIRKFAWWGTSHYQIINNKNINNECTNKNEKEKIFNNINVNVNLTEMDKIKGNYQENINNIRSIYEKMIIEKENKISELNNEINIIEKELEELNDKYDKEKENLRLSLIKINELEKEKISLLEEIKNLKGTWGIKFTFYK